MQCLRWWGFAGSNLIFFSAVQHVGASFVALTISLPPLLTYLGALAFRMERFQRLRAVGVAAALVGVGTLASRKLSTPDADGFWILLALAGPCPLAIGNLYRTLAGLTAYRPLRWRQECLSPLRSCCWERDFCPVSHLPFQWTACRSS